MLEINEKEQHSEVSEREALEYGGVREGEAPDAALMYTRQLPRESGE
jgi:hypothetical protein